ncbi:uncharacterized protein LOC108321157 [Vigna angularis]|uniref:uncharacterized protein LOC108321157 n=1 Tax=Phaseolus angularis TaxID=3914 RepID=UPI000809F178|nr:uncharacterized protein LOC108321157 [Vigna angularis]
MVPEQKYEKGSSFQKQVEVYRRRIKKPQRDDPLSYSWERSNMMMLSWIIKTLSSQITESVIYVEDAQELWKEFRERFSKGDYFKFSDLLQEIHSIKQGERSVNQYFIDLKILWEELEFLRPIPCCSCKIPCSCDLSKVSHKYREMKHVICFLKGLNESYNIVRTHILLMEPLPSINHVFSLIIQQQRQEKHDFGLTNQNDVKVLVSTSEKQGQWRNNQNWKTHGRGSAPRNQGRGRGRNPKYGKQCSYCHKINHIVDECYSKHGYPPWYKKNDNNTQNDMGQNEWGSANACSTTTVTQTDEQNNVNYIQGSFTLEQIQKILQMLEKAYSSSHVICQMHKDTTKDRKGILSWIIDTGATDHVTHDKNQFMTFSKIKPISVKLPNNSIVTAHYAGTARPSWAQNC